MSDKDVTLGEFLRNERELRGITIEQVASATKVGVRTLHALEADLYSELPAKPYIRGFVTSYCRFIGLDPKEIRSRFDSYISKRALERPNREGGHSGYAFDKKDGDQQGRTALMIGICSFIVIGGAVVLFLKPSLKHHRSSHIDRLRAAQASPLPGQELNSSPIAQISPSPAASTLMKADATVLLAGGVAEKPENSVVGPLNMATTPWIASSPSPVPSIKGEAPVIQQIPSPVPSVATQSAPQSAPNPDDPLDSGLTLRASEIHHKVIFKPEVDVWFRYQVDERPVRKIIVRKGKVLVLRAASQIQVQVSSPSSVPFSHNGKNYPSVSKAKATRMIHGVASLFFAESGSTESAFHGSFFSGNPGLGEVPAAENKQKPAAAQQSAGG